jgi:predicted Zn-dependent protease
MHNDVLSIDDLQSIAKKVISYGKSEWSEVELTSGHYGNLRYAANTVTTSGAHVNTNVSITAVNGKRAGSVTTNDLSEDGLRRAVKRAEEISALAPENEELMPPLPPGQSYVRSAAYDNASTDRDYAANERARIAQLAIKEANLRKLQTAGFIQSSTQHRCYRNSKGLAIGDEHTRSVYSTTMRALDGASSGWNKAASHSIAQLDPQTIVRRAAEKCVAWNSPREMDPGTYKTILEPSAVADMMQNLEGSFDAREAEEGRSAFSRQNGGTAVGEQLFSEKIHLYSDPNHPLVPSSVYQGGGEALKATDWIKEGKLNALRRSRFWAQKSGKPSVTGSSNLILDGGNQLPEDFLYNVKEGLLITSLWYIRDLDNQTLLKTGLTRDGLFWIEDGKIQSGVVNFRWNESPITLLKNVVDFSRPVVTAPRDGWDGEPMLMPMLYVSGFNYSSISDAI